MIIDSLPVQGRRKKSSPLLNKRKEANHQNIDIISEIQLECFVSFYIKIQIIEGIQLKQKNKKNIYLLLQFGLNYYLNKIIFIILNEFLKQIC